MPKTFAPKIWVDGPDGLTPMVAAELNRVEQGVDTVDTRVAVLEAAPGSAALIRETWTGTNGAAWPAAWTGAGGIRDIQTNSGRHITAATASAVVTSSRSGLGAGELLVRFQWDATAVERNQYFACRAADFDNHTHCLVRDTGAARNISIAKRVGGTPTTLSSVVAVSVSAGSWYWVRLRWSGGDYRARLWADGSPEPPDWTVQATDTTHTSGLLLLATGNGADAAARTTLLDDMQVWDLGSGSVSSVAGKTGAVTLDPVDVGLGNVANAAQVQLATVDAKGDLLAGTGDNAVSRVAVGGNGRVLTADSAQTAGVGWQANPTPAPVPLTDGTTVNLDASAGKVFTLSAGGSRTILAPTGAVDGRGIIIKHTASGGARTLSLTTGSAGSFKFGTDITGLTATTSGATDYIGCIYDATAQRWHVISYVKGL